jgi:hypothetical protein
MAKIIAMFTAFFCETNPEGTGLDFFTGCNLSSLTSNKSLKIYMLLEIKQKLANPSND